MYRPNRFTRLAVLAVAGSFAVSACGSSDSDSSSGGSSDEGSSAEKKGTQIYFVDGNTADYSGDFDPGTLKGVKATYPGAELGDAFRERMLGVNSKLKDFTYGPESYDATIVAALAATEEAEFGAVRDAVQVSDSALSKHAAALELAGYVRVRKGYVGKRPRTWLRLTPAGRAALSRHLAALRAIAGDL